MRPMPRRLGKVLVRIWLAGDLCSYHEPASGGITLVSAFSYIAARDNIDGRHGGLSGWGWGTRGSDAMFPRRRAWCQGCCVRAPQSPATHIGYRIRRMSARRRNSSAPRCKADVLWEPGLLPEVTLSGSGTWSFKAILSPGLWSRIRSGYARGCGETCS